SDMDPDRPGLEVWMVHETPSQYGVHGSELHDAATGAILFSVPATVDIGRGVAADIDPRTRGYEAWSSRANLHDVDGNEIVSSRPSPMNFFCWWDGDLLREMLDGTTVSKWNWTSNNATTLLAASGVSSNNTTKATPCLSADLFGDWREEIVWRESDSSALRIHTTPIPTDLRLPTLMHDRQYRLAIAWQNVGYNQPPHPGFYLGDGMGTPPHAEFTFVTPPDAPEPVAGRFPTWLAARGLDPGLDPNLDHDGNGMTLFAEYAFDLPGPPPLRMRQDGGTLTLDLAAARDELDYRIETTTDFVEWTPLLTLAGEAGPRAEIALTGGEPRCFYRAAALSGPGAPVLTEVTTTMQAEDAAFNGSLDSNHTGFSTIIRADGNIRYSTAIWVIPVTANLVLSWLFVMVLRIGVAGAALATVAGQAISAGMAVYFFFFRPNRSYQIKAAYFKPDWRLIGEVLLIGFPSLAKNLSASLLVIVTNNLLKLTGGDAGLAVYAIVSRLYASLNMPQTGIVQGMQPLVGFNFGQKKFARVQETIRLSLGASVIYGLLVLGLCLLFPAALISLLSQESLIISEGQIALRLLALSYPLTGIALITAASFQSIGRAKQALILTLGGILLVKLPVLLLAARIFALNGIWAAEAVSELILCLVALFMLRQFRGKTPQYQVEQAG
ncbi:MAG: polysaccharide biosynthesis C-terminal domain-containing protein, partial [Rhizobiaceae bacterium]|nr:polysaccharide biosynthesis C-terminal domain-containing protein [Rhizobiaceae bacterium]